MRILVFLMLSALALMGDIFREKGSGNSASDAIENAKDKILIKAHKKLLTSIPLCASMVSDKSVTYDADDFEVTLLGYKSIQKSSTQIQLEVEYDVEIINSDIIHVLQEQCQEEHNARQRSLEINDFLSQFHFGVGISGWVSTYGAEVFGEYRHDSHDFISDFSIYITYSYHQYQQASTTIDKYDTGTLSLAGGQLRFLKFLFVGYETVLALDAAPNTKIEPTSAIEWGLIYSPAYEESRFEFGLIFKDLNSENSSGEQGLTGGAFARMKFF